MSDYLERLEKRIRLLKNSYRGQNDFRRARVEIEKRGGTWRADNGLTYELRDSVIYVYYGEKGSSKMNIIAYDAPIPYTAELDVDIQSSRPGKPRMTLKELNKEIEKRVTKGTKPASPPAEIIIIIKDDWLSKISQQRWGTVFWENHLQPTQMTLNSPKRKGKPFDADLIYPGDSFEVKN